MSRVVALVSDLIFRTKIESTARSVGADLVSAASPAALADRISAGDVALVVIDMSCAGAAEAIAETTNHDRRPKIIAFVSHVEADVAAAARSQGADQVLARSAFSANLPDILREHA